MEVSFGTSPAPVPGRRVCGPVRAVVEACRQLGRGPLPSERPRASPGRSQGPPRGGKHLLTVCCEGLTDSGTAAGGEAPLSAIPGRLWDHLAAEDRLVHAVTLPPASDPLPEVRRPWALAPEESVGTAFRREEAEQLLRCVCGAAVTLPPEYGEAILLPTELHLAQTWSGDRPGCEAADGQRCAEPQHRVPVA